MRTPATLLLFASASFALAAPIPGLYNTGVDNDGNPLAPNTLDPHYTLTTSPDPTFPGPDIFTSSTIPSPPWLVEGPGSVNPDSRWITPNTTGGNVAGSPDNYSVTTTFDLTGFDHTTAEITGRWSTDNAGVDIIINGFSTGQSNDGNFGTWHDFFLDFPSDFVEGVNTIEFVFNNAGDAANPGGLRVEMVGTVDDPGAPPSFLVQPKSVATALEGDTVTLTTNVDGDPPLTLQWQKNGTDIPGETANALTLDNVTTDSSGDYTLVATNPNGSTTSNIATVSVASPIPGLFNTGVDDDGNLLFDFDFDPHYSIVVNPDSEFPEPILHDTLVFPIVEGPWLLAGTDSAWIAPRGDTVGAAGGDYHYRLTLDLTGLDPSTAFVTGMWSSDNAGTDILVNGTSTGQSQGGAFGQFHPFTVSAAAGAPFIQGTNTIDFVVNNASAGYTGLRVEAIRGGAIPGDGLAGAPEILRHPTSQIGFPEESLTLSVLADGTQPIAYQWRKNGADLPGEIGDTLFLFTGAPGVEGEYDVVVSNDLGNVTSDPATITLLDLVPGLFPTGVDDQGELLFDFDIDPHYTLIENAQDPLVTDAVVVTANGAWISAPEGDSLWIGAVGDTNSLPGNYTYRTTVDLSGFDPATAVLDARLATDDGLVGISINEAPFAFTGGGGFGSFSDIRVPAGSFSAGLNTIDFTVSNGGADANPHGFHVNRLRIGAAALPAIDLPPLTITRTSPSGVKLAWPTSATGWFLTTSTDARTWTAVPDAPTTEGENQTVTLTISQTTLFRLEIATP